MLQGPLLCLMLTSLKVQKHNRYDAQDLFKIRAYKDAQT